MHPDAEVRLPADPAYVAVLRMTAAGIAARLDFTLDDIEDLKMAVSEASALVLTDATPGGDLSARFYLAENRLSVEISATAINPRTPDPDSFTWQVLAATAEDVVATLIDGGVAITLSVTSNSTSTPR
jgi:serine/threonine-protein kinase RsbW